MNLAESAQGSFLNRLGFGGGRTRSAAAAPASPEGTTKADLVKQRRRQLIATMGDFLIDNDLSISPSNLLAAHGAFSGINPRLARQLSARRDAGQEISQAWLDEVTANDEAEDRDETIKTLIARLEENLDAFSNSSKTARAATSEYSSDLEHHMAEMEQVQQTGQIISSLADLAKAMAERTREVERDMRKSEEEANSLRRSLERAKHDAEIDHLTGLPNRRAFEALLDKHYREAQGALDSLSVAFCDIDHFKRVNDTHGHDTGDRVIRAVGEALSRIASDGCHVARHGGEEFVMLFRGLSPHEAKLRLDAVREELAARAMINRKTDLPIGQVTFSGGVANVFGCADPRAALKAADEALYLAKRTGRNQILVAQAAAESAAA